MPEKSSTETAKAAIKLAISSRIEEKELKRQYQKEGILAAAVDFGGEFNKSVTSMIERAVVAATREGIIKETHVQQGAVAGAAHEALSQLMSRAVGLNIGGKIGLARSGEHLVVAVFFEIGMLNLNEIALGLGHRSIPSS